MTAMSRNADAASLQVRELREHGCCLVPDALPPTVVGAPDTGLTEACVRGPSGQGYFCRAEAKRCGPLLARAAGAEAIVRRPLAPGLAEPLPVPGCGHIQLTMAQPIAAHPDQRALVDARLHTQQVVS